MTEEDRLASSLSPTTSTAERPLRNRLLVVDDESSIRWALQRTLRAMGFDVSEAATGEQALALVRTVRFDVVLLDIGMPGMDGIETCREIRRLSRLVGILMLSVRDGETDKIQALDAGADDYVTKPFNVGELAARIRAVMRRAHTLNASTPAILAIGEIQLNSARRVVQRGGVTLHLTPKEFDLLQFLMSHAGLSLTHARLLSAVWGQEYRDQVEYLRTFVRQLRKKLGDDAANPRYLITDAHVGYRFRAEEELAQENETQ